MWYAPFWELVEQCQDISISWIVSVNRLMLEFHVALHDADEAVYAQFSYVRPAVVSIHDSSFDCIPPLSSIADIR